MMNVRQTCSSRALSSSFGHRSRRSRLEKRRVFRNEDFASAKFFYFGGPDVGARGTRKRANPRWGWRGKRSDPRSSRGGRPRRVGCAPRCAIAWNLNFQSAKAVRGRKTGRLRAQPFIRKLPRRRRVLALLESSETRVRKRIHGWKELASRSVSLRSARTRRVLRLRQVESRS